MRKVEKKINLLTYTVFIEHIENNYFDINGNKSEFIDRLYGWNNTIIGYRIIDNDIIAMIYSNVVSIKKMVNKSYNNMVYDFPITSLIVDMIKSK